MSRYPDTYFCPDAQAHPFLPECPDTPFWIDARMLSLSEGYLLLNSEPASNGHLIFIKGILTPQTD